MNYVFVNRSGGELLGRKPQDLIGKNYWKEYPEAKGTSFAKAYVRAFETQKPIVFEDYYEPFGRWFENRIYPSADGISILFTEITERKKAELLIADEKNILEMIAQGIALPLILQEITLKVEVHTSGMLCTILLLDADGIHIRHAAAPSMEESYIRAIDGQPIGPKAGSCGTAAYRKESVYVSDIASGFAVRMCRNMQSGPRCINIPPMLMSCSPPLRTCVPLWIFRIATMKNGMAPVTRAG